MFRARHVLTAVLVCLGAATFTAQDDPVRQYVIEHRSQILTELVELLRVPNIAADRANIRKNAVLLRELLVKRGFAAEVLETEVNPLVFGERQVQGASRTILFYAHYDGQPVDPAGWKQESPFAPVLRGARLEDNGKNIPNFLSLQSLPAEGRLYARSASDDKAPIVAILAALDGLEAAKTAPTSNIKIILDGEEEAGSRGLATSMARYRDKYRADLMLVLDGPLHPSGKPTLTFGARGNLTLELTVYGPKTALHSGHYGNWAPNPAIELARLLASMKDGEGRVLVKGFYDDVPPLSADTRGILAAVPDRPDELMHLFGLGRTEKVGTSLQEALQYPSLNVRGLRSGYVGADARTIIPETAVADVDVRLVKETDPDRMAARVLDHIRTQGFHVTDSNPDDAARARYPRIVKVVRGRGTKAYRTEMNIPESMALARAFERTWGEPPVRIRTSGGTVPIDFFIEALNIPAIGVPVVNFDNNQHSENENLRLQNLWDAVVSFAAILRM